MTSTSTTALAVAAQKESLEAIAECARGLCASMERQGWILPIADGSKGLDCDVQVECFGRPARAFPSLDFLSGVFAAQVEKMPDGRLLDDPPLGRTLGLPPRPREHA